MAKAGHIMGGARGKVGDYVYMKGEKGKTIVRVKVTPANPKTIAQGKQRLAFAMATSAAAGLRFLINHSFENVKSGKLCEREFVRINARLLRAEIDAFIAGTAGFNGNAQIKGAKTLQAADYIISRGSAYFPAFHGDKSAQYGTCCKIPALGEGSSLVGTISDQTAYEQVLALIGLKPGDQISFISMYDFPTTIIQYDSETNALCKVFASRVTFKAKPDFSNHAPLVVDGKISEQYIEESFGPEIKIFYRGISDEIVYSQDGEEAWGNPLQAVGIIRTTKTINGKYEYSPCQMQFLDEGNNPEIVLMSYLPQNASTTDEYFLDQAESGGGRKPAPAPSNVIVTNDGITATYNRTKLSDNIYEVTATLPASDHVTYIDIHGVTGILGNTDWPPTSNIESISFVDGNLRVTGSSPWLPAPFNLDFEVQLDEDNYEFHVTFV